MRLSDLINEAYLQYRIERGRHDAWNSLDTFFYDKGKCLGMLYHFLDLGFDHYKDIMPDNLYRCQHTFVTFLLGWAIAKRYGLLNGINVINNMPDGYLWILTSLVHDYGYLNKRIADAVSLEELDGKYHLLSDTSVCRQLDSTLGYSSKYPQFMTYSYETISNYFNYRLVTLNTSHRKSKDSEFVDHGIFGACKCYEEYCDFYIKNEYPRSCITKDDNAEDIKQMGYEWFTYNNESWIVELARTEPLLYKTACLITAQHNIFKSSDTKKDLEYEHYGLSSLLSTEPIAIDKNNPLLFLLSLVDTIECTKRFEKLYWIDGCSKPISLPIKHVLDNVQIQLNDDGIIIDYSSLSSVIKNYCSLFNSKKKKAALRVELDKQMSSVIGLKDWVNCETIYVGPLITKIVF